MTDYAIVTDHTAQALSLLIDQYQGLPRLTGLVSSYVNRVQELENILWAVINKRLLDYTALDGTTGHAVAAQLDAIGRLVGRGRNGQDDATYLVYVRAQIFLNKSKAARDDVIMLLRIVEAVAFKYSELYPATVLVTFTNAPTTSPLILTELAKRAVTGGVKLFLTAPPPAFSASTMFAFCNIGDASNPFNGFSDSGSAPGFRGALASVYA